jgi:YbbR domain-containing protein
MKIIIIIAVVVAAVLMLAIAAAAAASTSAQQQTNMTTTTTSATDGGLSVSISKNNYTAGEFIVINGTVAEYTDPSTATILVTDPEGRQVEHATARISAQDNKNQFRYVFQAGLVKQFDPDFWMKDSGEYEVTVTFQPPSLVTPEIERVKLYFNYSNVTTTTATTTANTTTTR